MCATTPQHNPSSTKRSTSSTAQAARRSALLLTASRLMIQEAASAATDTVTATATDTKIIQGRRDYMNSAQPMQTDFSNKLPAKTFYRFIKRTFDIIVSILALIILSPFFIIIAACIKLGDREPVFFGHRRIGRNGREFKLYKFRSMVTNAENEIESKSCECCS